MEYLEEAMNLYGKYSTNSIEKIVDTINHLHKTLSKQEKILSGRQFNCYKDNISEKEPIWLSTAYNTYHIYMSYKWNMWMHMKIW